MKKPWRIHLQYLLPHHGLSRFAGKMAFCEWKWLKNYLIQDFIKRYDVDLSEAERSNVKDYIHFNDFFTRALKSGVRPLGEGIVSPCDGAIGHSGMITDRTLLQAKGHTYSTEKLLANEALATTFEGGHYATFYLSPKDYHRVHMPCAGQLLQMTYVPGALYSVSPDVLNHVEGVFAKNERLICLFETPHGKMAVILIGAMIVGSMATTWSGTVLPHQPTLTTWTYEHNPQQHIALEKGAEMGLFHLGSSVILLFEHDDVQLNLKMEDNVQVRQRIGDYIDR